MTTYFPEDPNCEVCKWINITRVPCRKRTSSRALRAEMFGDLITADQKFLQKRANRQQQSQVCSCCTRFGHSVDSKLPMQNKNFTRNDEKFSEVVDANAGPKVMNADKSIEFAKACEDHQ